MVLIREQRRRHEHRDLLAAFDRGERRAQRDLGLAEADVAADYAVHRLTALEIREHLVDRGELVLGLLERKLEREPMIALGAELEPRALASRALRVQIQELRGDVACLIGRLALGFRPLIRAEPV